MKFGLRWSKTPPELSGDISERGIILTGVHRVLKALQILVRQLQRRLR